jgi:hypothetical protein
VQKKSPVGAKLKPPSAQRSGVFYAINFCGSFKHSFPRNKCAIAFAKEPVACLGYDSVHQVTQKSRYEVKHFGPAVTRQLLEYEQGGFGTNVELAIKK